MVSIHLIAQYPGLNTPATQSPWGVFVISCRSRRFRALQSYWTEHLSRPAGVTPNKSHDAVHQPVNGSFLRSAAQLLPLQPLQPTTIEYAAQRTIPPFYYNAPKPSDRSACILNLTDSIRPPQASP